MIISHNPQNTPEWKADRLGCPSSSEFKRIVDSKCNRSKSRQKYMDELASEIITSEFANKYYNADMAEGKEREQENIDLYAFRNSVKIEQVGFCWKDEKKLFGASPDALVNDDGLLECKNSNGAQQISRIRDGWTASEHHRQVMGQMLVTGRKWCDVVSYCRGMKTVTVRFERDEEFLRKLEIELILFHSDLQKLVLDIRG